MQFSTHSLTRRGLTTLAASAVFLSSALGIASSSAMAQDASTPSAASTPTSVVSNVDTSGCWDTAPDYSNVYPQWSQAPNMVIDTTKTYTATMTTNLGVITIALNASAAPVTVNNFVCLSGNGYYDKTYFHRILAGFVVQGGDPSAAGPNPVTGYSSGGTGGPGYQFQDELPGDDLNYTQGTIAMANAGSGTNGSQFFICLDDLTDRLPKDYTIFGQVTGGLDVVTALAATPVTTSALSGEASAPTSSVGIVSVVITEA